MLQLILLKYWIKTPYDTSLYYKKVRKKSHIYNDMASVVTTYVVCLKTGFEPVTSEISSPHAAAAPFQTHLYRLFFATVVAIPIPRVELGT